MRDLWERLDFWFTTNTLLSAEERGFRKGAAPADLAAAESAMNITFPGDFLQSWLIHDGQEHFWEFGWLPDGMGLLPISEIVKQWKTEYRYYLQYKAESEAFFSDWQEEGKIANAVFHPKRIPFASSEGECSLWLDFAPGPKGTPGQVIFNVTECDFVVLGRSYREFFSRYLQLLETGRRVYDHESRSIIPADHNIENYLVYWRELFR